MHCGPFSADCYLVLGRFIKFNHRDRVRPGNPSNLKPKKLIFKERSRITIVTSARGTAFGSFAWARPIRLDSPSASGTTLSCSYLPRTRMRMLNSSAVLNGQPAILAWSVTSIQLPPETIQACPINQPIRYPRANSDPCLPSPLSLSLSVSCFHPTSLRPSTQNRCLSPSSPCGPHPTLRFLLNPRPLSWQTARSTSNLVLQPSPSPFSPAVPANPHPTCTPILYAPYRQFFFPPSRICAWGLVRSMKVLPDGARRATYIIVKHAMRAIPAWRLEYRKCPRVCARVFCRSRRAAKVLDLAEVLEQALIGFRDLV